VKSDVTLIEGWDEFRAQAKEEHKGEKKPSCSAKKNRSRETNKL
jgi:hypothetical protein